MEISILSPDPIADSIGENLVKILIICDYAYPSGGAEFIVKGLRDSLNSRGHEARIFSTNLSNETGENFADFTCIGTTSKLRGCLQTFNPFASIKLEQVLDEFRPDIIHVRIFLTQLSPSILKHLTHYKSIYHLAWYRLICPTGTKHLPNGTACKFDFGNACLKNKCIPWHDWPMMMYQLKSAHSQLDRFDAIVSNSVAVQQEFAKAGIVSRVIYNGTTVVNIRSNRDNTFDKSDPLILYAGRLKQEKGCSHLIKAFLTVSKRNKKVRLVLAGDGPERHHLEDLAEELDLSAKVDFLGFLDQEDLNDVTRSATVQVVPSLWQEPFGISALDAMKNAIPVVASDVGGLSEIIQDDVTGYLVKLGDTDHLAARIMDILDDRKNARKMGLSGYNQALNKFSFDRFTDSFLDLYNELLES